MSSSKVRTFLEEQQVSIYLAAVAIAAILAWLWPGSTVLSTWIDPLLAFMLFVTFLQVPLIELKRAYSNRKFLGALLTANFIAVPILVAALLPMLPGEPLIQVAVLLVLLTPCIDYVVTFAHLGKADARSLLASTPVLLALQMLLLPLYLHLFLGEVAAGLVHWGPFLHAFLVLIVVPLVLAGVFQAWASSSESGTQVVGFLGLLPVPATAAVLFAVVAAVTPQLEPALEAVRAVAPFYVLFAVAAPLTGWFIAMAWRLPHSEGRSVAFSAATRNSLVVLPLGLAIPGAVPLVPAVIVAQTLVELLSELIYIKLIPRLGNAVSPSANDA